MSTEQKRTTKQNIRQCLQQKLGEVGLRGFLADWKWILCYSRRHSWLLVCYTLLGIAGATLNLGAAVTGKELIDAVQNRDASRLLVLIGILLGSVVLSLLLSSLVSHLSARISVQVNNDIQTDLYARILDANWSSVSHYANGDLLNRFQNDVHTVSSNAVNWLPKLIISAYSFLATLAVLLYYDWIMALIALMSTPFLLLTGRYLLKRQRQLREQMLQTSSDMMSFESETFANYDTIKSFGAGGYYAAELKRWHALYRDCNLAYNRFSIRANIALSLMGLVISYAAFGYCLLRLWGGGITFGTMTLFLQQRSKLTANFDALVSAVPGMLNGAVSARRVRELLQLPVEDHDEQAKQQAARWQKEQLQVCVEQATASYAVGDAVLTQCSITAAPGEMVAIIGASGGGKTTLLRLLLGLLQPTEGCVTLRAQDGTQLPMCADLRSLFAYVPQGNSMLRGSVAENLRMVRPDATEDEMTQALQAACAWEFVQELGGLQAQIGERGKGLSEGQAQRIAIARAILCDAPILLLDEATSALDEETEARVLQAIMTYGGKKTCIVTSHRPSVLQLCSRVYRISNRNVKLEQ